MAFGEHSISYSLCPQSPHSTLISISLPQPFIENIYRYTLEQHKHVISTHGFSRGATPLSYLELNYKAPVINYLKDFFFNYCILNELLKHLATDPLLTIGEPELVDVKLDPASGATYTFKAHTVMPDIQCEWRRSSFKAPQRKNYKDLDRQVELFLKDEQAKASTYEPTITVGDWVCFDLYLLDNKEQELIPGYKNRLWLKISDEDTDIECLSIFAGRKKGDSFVSDSLYFQEYINPHHNFPHIFGIDIVDVSPVHYFSFDLFKKQFKVKTHKDLHQKLIEVFSHRNDISQRRETAESIMKLVRDGHHITIPDYLIDRQQHLVLDTVHENPDYNVYKSQPDFKKQVRQLAEKQLRESTLADFLSKNEKISADHEDILGYMNLLKRPRMKEFIYFSVPLQKIGGQEFPIPHQIVHYYALREKTLNYLIYQLTKK